MRANEFITEVRDRMYQYIRSIVPTWPEYVVQDLLYKGRGKNKNYNVNSDVKGEILEMIADAGLSPNTNPWQLVPNMKFTMDMFTPKTKQNLIARAGGKSDLGMGIPKDAERHATQAALVQQVGVSKEPVILIKTPQGYALPEGWHRTIQHFAKYPDGYTGPAYVAVAHGQNSLEEGLEDYEGIKIKFSKDSNGVAIKALSNDSNKVLGSVELFFNEKGQLEPQDLWVNDRYQGQGIAKAMYDFLKNKGYTIIRSWDQTDAGAGFWNKHKGTGVNVWEQGVAEGISNDMSTKDMIAYLRQHHDTNLHQDYLNHINTFSKFVLQNVPVNSIKTDLPKLDREKVEQYKQMDFSKAPPIVMGGGYILDGYHRVNVAKALGIPTIKAYVGVN